MSDRATDEELIVPISLADLGILRHALGLEHTRERGGGSKLSRKVERNYYCASLPDERLERLVLHGLMMPGRTINEGQDRYYHATRRGALFAGLSESEAREACP